LIYPQGNDTPHLGIYLVPHEPLLYPRDTLFTFEVVNQLNSKANIKRLETFYSFAGDEDDWGYTWFMPISQLRGDAGFLLHDTLMIVLRIQDRSLITLRLVTEADLRAHKNRPELVSFEKVREYEVDPAWSLTDFKDMIFNESGVPPYLQQFWGWSVSYDKTIRPDQIITKKEEKTKFKYMTKDWFQYSFVKRLLLVTHATSPPVNVKSNLLSNTPHFYHTPKNTCKSTSTCKAFRSSPNLLLVFFKFYDPVAKSLRYVGNAIVQNSYKIKDLHMLMNTIAGFTEYLQRNLLVYEEVKPSNVPLLQPNITLFDAMIGNGSILVFQHVPDDVLLCSLPNFYHELSTKPHAKQTEDNLIWGKGIL